ncbi:MAG: choice-of-anchor D domain-containing protein [Thermoleophilia bacterium]
MAGRPPDEPYDPYDDRDDARDSLEWEDDRTRPIGRDPEHTMPGGRPPVYSRLPAGRGFPMPPEPGEYRPRRRRGVGAAAAVGVLLAAVIAVGAIYLLVFRDGGDDEASGGGGDSVGETFIPTDAVGPDIVVSRNSIDFGDGDVGKRSKPETVTISNGFDEEVTPLEVAVTGDAAAEFPIDQKASTCGAGTPIPVGATCDVVLRFAPKKRGERTGTLVVRFTGEQPRIEVGLRGAGTGKGTLTPEAATLDFGNQEPDTSSPPRGIRFQDTGNLPVKVAAVRLAGKNAKDFRIVVDDSTCRADGVVKPKKACLVTVRFRPTTLGERRARLVIDHDGEDGPTSVQLLGTGKGVGAAELSATSIAFGEIEVGQDAQAQEITLQSVGTAPLVISEITVEGNRKDFTVTNDCPGPKKRLDQEASCVVTVVFSPTKAGDRAATILIQHDGEGSPARIEVSGVGAAKPEPAPPPPAPTPPAPEPAPPAPEPAPPATETG